MLKKFKEVYQYREMLKSLVQKNLRSRYKASFLGFLWTFVNPLLQLVVYAVVFQVVFGVKIPNYAMFLFVALLPWTAFNISVIASLTSVVGNVNLVKKIYFPRMILPLSTVTTYIMDFIYCLPILILALLCFKIPLTINVLWLPLIILLQFIISTGIAFIVSSLNVKFRDLEQIVNIGMMIWFYFSPVLYATNAFPEKIKQYMLFNPMVGIMEGYRDSLFYGIPPDPAALTVSATVGLILFFIGYYLFNKLERTFAEDL